MHWQGCGARELSFTAGGNVNWKKEFEKEIFSTEIEDARILHILCSSNSASRYMRICSKAPVFKFPGAIQ